jgi:hypothetical protein
VEEGAAVELFVVLVVCVLEVTGDRFDFLVSGEEDGGAESFVFFFLRRPPNVGITARGAEIGYREDAGSEGRSLA